MLRRPLQLLPCLVALTIGGTTTVEAAEGRLQATAMSVPLVLSTSAQRSFVRLDLDRFASEFRVTAARRFRLAATEVRGTYVIATGEQDVSVSLSAFDAPVTKLGGVAGTQKMVVRDAQGKLLLQAKLHIEIDLLGLGERSPHLTVRRMLVNEIEVPEKRVQLANRPTLAWPTAPLVWKVREARAVAPSAKSPNDRS